jgi:hypothetical protein
LEIKAHVVVVVVMIVLMMFGLNLEIKAHMVVVMIVLMMFGLNLEIKAHMVVVMIVLMMFGSNLEIKAHVVVMMIVLMMCGSNQHQDVDAAAAAVTATMVATVALMAATVALMAATVAVLTVKMVLAAWVPTMMFVFLREEMEWCRLPVAIYLLILQLCQIKSICSQLWPCLPSTLTFSRAIVVVVSLCLSRRARIRRNLWQLVPLWHRLKLMIRRLSTCSTSTHSNPLQRRWLRPIVSNKSCHQRKKNTRLQSSHS